MIAVVCRNTARLKHANGSALVLVLILMFGGSYWYLKNTTAVMSAGFEVSSMQRMKALQIARESLIAYAVSYADNYPASGAGVGHLPCPDTDNPNDGDDGNDGPDPPCNQPVYSAGWMPRFTSIDSRRAIDGNFKLLDFYPYKSMTAQRLWYVVSASYVNNPLNRVVNPATRGNLVVDDKDNIVAIIIAPGDPDIRWGQTGMGTYLYPAVEGENADNDRFFTSRPSTASNDLLVYISADQLARSIASRVALFVADWLREYQSLHCTENAVICFPPDHLQGLALFDSLSVDGVLSGVPLNRHWVIRNQWPQFIDYQLDESCRQYRKYRCSVTTRLQSVDRQWRIQVQVFPQESL